MHLISDLSFKRAIRTREAQSSIVGKTGSDNQGFLALSGTEFSRGQAEKQRCWFRVWASLLKKSRLPVLGPIRSTRGGPCRRYRPSAAAPGSPRRAETMAQPTARASLPAAHWLPPAPAC